jgi:hypothetical protein
MSFLTRRGLIASLLAATGASAAQASATPGKLRVVYHLSDSDKVIFVLGNMQNHIKGLGGPDKIALALVVHGPALARSNASMRISRFPIPWLRCLNPA